MRLIIISIVALVVFSGCDPCKRLWRRCPPVIIDSVRVDSVWKLDTLELISPADTVWLGEGFLDEIGLVYETESQKVTVKPDKTVEFICKEDSLEGVVRVLKYQLSSHKTYIKEVQVYIPVTKIPKWAWYTLIFSGLTVVLGGVVSYVKIKAKWFKRV